MKARGGGAGVISMSHNLLKDSAVPKILLSVRADSLGKSQNQMHCIVLLGFQGDRC